MSEEEVKPQAIAAETIFKGLLDGDYDSAVTFVEENPYEARDLVDLVMDKIPDKKLQKSMLGILIERLAESSQEKDKLTQGDAALSQDE